MRSRAQLRRRRQTILFASVAGALLAVVGVALLVSRGHAKDRTLDTPTGVARAAVERAIAGDTDGVRALTGGEGIVRRVLECNADNLEGLLDDATRDQQRIVERVEGWKKLALRIEAVVPSGDSAWVLHIGKNPRGCTVKSDVARQNVKVKLGGTPDGQAEVVVETLQIGGRWYLGKLPPPPDDDHLTLAKMKNEMCACRDKDCVDRVQGGYTAWMKTMTAKLSSGARPDAALMRLGEELAKCMADAMSASR